MLSNLYKIGENKTLIWDHQLLCNFENRIGFLQKSEIIFVINPREICGTNRVKCISRFGVCFISSIHLERKHVQRIY